MAAIMVISRCLELTLPAVQQVPVMPSGKILVGEAVTAVLAGMGPGCTGRQLSFTVPDLHGSK